MRSMRQLLPVVVAVAAWVCAACRGSASPEPPAPIAAHRASASTPSRLQAAASACFAKRRGCFAAFEAGSGWVRNDADACSARYSPQSTFKIPNSIIGLEEGVIEGADTVLDWDRERYPAEDWWPESWLAKSDLRAAFANSVVPYYRHLATRVGAEAMQRRLDQFDYGNRAIGDNLDSFWLEGPLEISANEQIDFLRRFEGARLGASVRSTEVVKDIMVVERRADAVLRAKTGMGTLAGGTTIGWYVGIVERGSTKWFFAANVLGGSFDEVREPRIDVSRTLLRVLGAFDYDAPGCQ